MDDPLKKYTLVRGPNGELYAVTEDDKSEPIQEQQLIDEVQRALDGAETAVAATLLSTLGSGVKVRVPKIFD